MSVPALGSLIPLDAVDCREAGAKVFCCMSVLLVSGEEHFIHR